MQAGPPPGALVLGARNLGGAIARAFREAGWGAAAVARSPEGLTAVRAAGIPGIEADAGDPAGLASAIAEAQARLGRLDAIVNAVSAAEPPDDGRPFGGGDFAEATPEGFEGWTVAPARQAFVFLSEGVRALRPTGGALVQVTGGSARRAIPGKGLWAAGAAGIRALTHAAALEQRSEGLHVALLVVDGIIASPRTAGATHGMAPEATVDQDEVARAAVYLAGQGARALSHELVLTPAGDRWVP